MNCEECGSTILAVDADVDPRSISLRLRAQCGHLVPPATGRALWNRGMRWTLPAVDGAALLAAERYRQVHEEGYTAEDDDALQPSELSWAAWCLLDAAGSGKQSVPDVPGMWPDVAGEWKPDQPPLRRLVIAGALIAAEIDKRLREMRRQA